MNKQMWIVAVLMLGLGAVGGYLVAPEQVMEQQENKILYYRNPMNPAITSPVFTRDEMGMDYIAVYADDKKESAGTVSINPVVMQNIGVRTVVAKRETMARMISTVGRITFDEKRVTSLHPKYDGWVEQMFVDQTGDHVRKGDMLMSIYSPQLVATQEEYLLALSNAEALKASPFKDVQSGAASLLQSSLERLQLLDVPEHQIRQLNRERKVMKALHIHSPFDGIVMNIGARDGQRITADTELYKIADLSAVWVIVDLYEDDMPWVQVGDVARMQVAGVPGQLFMGKVSYIYPYLEAKTRTVKMRLEFDNPKLQLKPEMFARVTVQAAKQVDALVIPAEAIVRTGEQEQVFVQREPGRYEPRKVVLGVTSQGMVQVVQGLEEGDVVVTSGQFLIDSESKLKEATAKMMGIHQAGDALTTEEPGHEDMNMDSMDMESMDDHSAEGPNGTTGKLPGVEEHDTPNQMGDMQMEGM